MLLRYDGVKWTEYPQDGIFPSQMAVGPDGAAWFFNDNRLALGDPFAYRYGAFVFRFDGNQWSHFDSVQPDGSFTEKIFVAPDNAIWFTNSLDWTRYKP
jgi:streptogramin lyase